MTMESSLHASVVVACRSLRLLALRGGPVLAAMVVLAAVAHGPVARSLAASPTPPRVELARDGQALLPIRLAAEAEPEVGELAETLAQHLNRMTGAKFPIHRGGEGPAIRLGLADDFPRAMVPSAWKQPGLEQREAYLLRTAADGVDVLAATPLGLRHAVWDLLYRLGYRQYFPGRNWEVHPRSGDLALSCDAAESPDYRSRRIWYGFGAWDYAAEPYRQWCEKNRAVPGMQLNTGHAYGGIIRANQAEFDRHPEYYALVDGRRNVHPQAKLCIGNRDLRQLVAEHARRHFREHPDADSISMDPSDGGGWCECDACREIGSPSDRALLLANDVAAAINPPEAHRSEDKTSQRRLVGMYAYNYHSPPPSLDAHPAVVISVATAFLKGGLTLDQIMRGWSRRGASLGIREYYSVNTWDRDLPAKARGSNLEYLARTIPEFHEKGARYLSAESSDNWGPNGLGYYVAARILWDIDEAKHVDELVEDFLTRCFGPAKEPMRAFYAQLDGGESHLVYDDQLGRMFRALREARRLADSPEIHARLDDLLLYARYADLFDRYRRAEGDARQAAFEQLIRHTYRMRTTMLVHAKALYRDLAARDKSVRIPTEAAWNVPEDRNPWKSSRPFSPEELGMFLREGIERRPLVDLDFEPLTFGEELVPAAPLNLSSVNSGQLPRGRGVQTFFYFAEQAPAELELRVTGGLIKHYRDRGNVRVVLSKLGGSSETGERTTPVAEDRSVPPDGVERSVRLPIKEAGLYQIEVLDGGDMTSVRWKEGTRICRRSSLEYPIRTNGRWTLYFYVPLGTRRVGMFGGDAPGAVVDPRGDVVLRFDDRKAGFHSVPVAAGTDGRLWKIQNAAGAIRLLNVPPYLARSAEELLLPREVVERDKHGQADR